MAVRVDRWLWSVRVFKTRTQASSACTAGRVSISDRRAKPASRVEVGDVVRVERRDRVIVYEVLEAIDRRVSAARAAECVIDSSPPLPERQPHLDAPAARRAPGAGRPTKRDRRRIDRLRRRG